MGLEQSVTLAVHAIERVDLPVLLDLKNHRELLVHPVLVLYLGSRGCHHPLARIDGVPVALVEEIVAVARCGFPNPAAQVVVRNHLGATLDVFQEGLDTVRLDQHVILALEDDVPAGQNRVFRVGRREFRLVEKQFANHGQLFVLFHLLRHVGSRAPHLSHINILFSPHRC